GRGRALRRLADPRIVEIVGASRRAPTGMDGRVIWACTPHSAKRALYVQSAVAHSPPARPRQGGGRSLSSPPRTCRHSFGLSGRNGYISPMRILVIEDDREGRPILPRRFARRATSSMSHMTA